MDNVLATIIEEKHLEVQALTAAKDFATLDCAARGALHSCLPHDMVPLRF